MGMVGSRDQFIEHVVPLCDDEPAAWRALQRLCVRTMNEPTLRAVVEQHVRAMLRGEDGQPADLMAVRPLIGDFLTDNLGRRLTAESILDDLETHRFVRSRTPRRRDCA